MVCGRADTIGVGWGGAVSPPGLVRLNLYASRTQQHLGRFWRPWVVSLLFSCPQAAAAARWADFPASPSPWLKGRPSSCSENSFPGPLPAPLPPGFSASHLLVLQEDRTCLLHHSVLGVCSWVREGRTGICFCLLWG